MRSPARRLVGMLLTVTALGAVAVLALPAGAQSTATQEIIVVVPELPPGVEPVPEPVLGSGAGEGGTDVLGATAGAGAASGSSSLAGRLPFTGTPLAVLALGVAMILVGFVLARTRRPVAFAAA